MRYPPFIVHTTLSIISSSHPFRTSSTSQQTGTPRARWHHSSCREQRRHVGARRQATIASPSTLPLAHFSAERASSEHQPLRRQGSSKIDMTEGRRCRRFSCKGVLPTHQSSQGKGQGVRSSPKSDLQNIFLNYKIVEYLGEVAKPVGMRSLAQPVGVRFFAKQGS